MSAAGSEPGVHEVTIGSANPTELAEIAKAWWSLVQEQGEHDGRMVECSGSRRRGNHFLRRAVIDGRMLVARLEGRIVGISTFAEDHHFLDDSGMIWVIADVWIAPDQRRRGIATRLVKATERACIERGAQEVRLQVYDANEAALGLYRSLGYGACIHTLRKRLEEY